MSEVTATTYRLLVWSANRVSGSTTDYVIEVSPAYNEIVYVDWASVSVPGMLLYIEEFAQNGRSTSNTYYWRFPAEYVNTRYARIKDSGDEPRSIRKLTIHWRNPDGSVPASFPEHTLELELWKKW